MEQSPKWSSIRLLLLLFTPRVERTFGRRRRKKKKRKRLRIYFEDVLGVSGPRVKSQEIKDGHFFPFSIPRITSHPSISLAATFASWNFIT